jgi:hypothetical protein
VEFIEGWLSLPSDWLFGDCCELGGRVDDVGVSRGLVRAEVVVVEPDGLEDDQDILPSQSGRLKGGVMLEWPVPLAPFWMFEGIMESK